MDREKPMIRRYAHHYPLVVEKAEGSRRAGCLECGAVAPRERAWSGRWGRRRGQRLGA
jgi:hypothetical protein